VSSQTLRELIIGSGMSMNDQRLMQAGVNEQWKNVVKLSQARPFHLRHRMCDRADRLS
jgi:hypothetical protein